jgi:hypothetical protein
MSFTAGKLLLIPNGKSIYNYSQNTNWVKEITQVAFTNQHDFSVRGRRR